MHGQISGARVISGSADDREKQRHDEIDLNLRRGHLTVADARCLCLPVSGDGKLNCGDIRQVAAKQRGKPPGAMPLLPDGRGGVSGEGNAREGFGLQAGSRIRRILVLSGAISSHNQPDPVPAEWEVDLLQGVSQHLQEKPGDHPRGLRFFPEADG